MHKNGKCLACSSISGWQYFLHAGFWHHFRPEKLSSSPPADPPLLLFPSYLHAASLLRLTLPLPSTALHALCFFPACYPSSLYLIHSLTTVSFRNGTVFFLYLPFNNLYGCIVLRNVHTVIDFRHYMQYFKSKGIPLAGNYTQSTCKVFQCLGKIRISSR